MKCIRAKEEGFLKLNQPGLRYDIFYTLNIRMYN